MSDTTNATPRVRLAGRYDLLDRLGEGGMGVVHKAWDCNLKTDVVIKIPRMNVPAAKQFADRFAREVQSLVRLRHPHVVGILDVGEHQGAPFAVLQYLSGGSLKDRGARDFTGRPVPVSPASLRGWLAEIAGALDFVHAQGFVHRDVKPDNILFDAHGNVFLSDFGIAKVWASLASDSSGTNLTNPGGLIGTVAYMAPEQMGGQVCDGRADQYALAVTVYEQLAGKGPFADLTFNQVIVRKASNEVQPLYAVNPAIAKAVAAVVQRGMAPEPKDRFPTCAALAKALLGAVTDGTESLPPTGTFHPPGPVSLPCPGCGNTIPLTPALFGKRVSCFKCRREHSVAPDGRQLAPTAPIPPPLPTPSRPVPPPLPSPRRETAPLSLDDTEPLLPDAPHKPGRRSKVPLLLAGVAALSALVLGLALYRFWPRGTVTRDDVVTGTIDIDFKTRQKDAPPDAVDTYTVDLVVRTEDDLQVFYRGTIHRRAPTKGAAPVPGSLRFNLTITAQRVTTAGQPVEGKVREVGKITGIVPRSGDGLYTFDKLEWTNELGATLPFAGKMQEKRRDDRERRPIEVPVFVGGERMTYLVADSDPMKFHELVLPEDTGLKLPAAELAGDLTFDYQKGSYLPNDLTFTSGKTADRVMGIINWDKNPAEYVRNVPVGELATNARSQYRFNLVFVPAATAPGSGGGRVSKDDEKRLAVTDKSLSTLTGSIDYSDDGPVRKEVTDLEPSVLPYRSKLTFRLNANRLTPRQVHMFLRMWLLMSGPVNDE